MVGALDFIVVVIVLYLAECFKIMRRNEVVFDLDFAFRYRTKAPIMYPSDNWGWTFLNPLTPAAIIFSAAVGATTGAPRSFDTKSLAKRIEQLQRRVTGIRTISRLLFLILFGAFPAISITWGIGRALIVFIPIVLGLALMAAFFYARTVKAFDPKIATTDLWGNIVKLGLYPISAVRATMLVSQDSLSGYDPIAIAMVLCGKTEAARIAAKEWITLRYRNNPETGQDDWTARLEKLEKFAAQHRLPMGDFISRPKTIDAGCQTFCPSCGAQYKLTEGVCADCPDIQLQCLAGTPAMPAARGASRER